MPDFDFIVIGSGFGGSVAAWRLIEKGYRVLLLERGRRFSSGDFAATNWDLRRWLWMPKLGMHGPFTMTFLPHVTVLGGAGFGGGSLVYANTLPHPPDAFFSASSWSGLADWKQELAPHYDEARRMLGAVANPHTTPVDDVFREMANENGTPGAWQRPHVAVFFGTPGQTVADPFFGGAGPSRTGCTLCGGCMTGCRVGAKNTLDRNYLHLAERGGLRVHTECTVTRIRRIDHAYRVEARLNGAPTSFTAARVVVAGGVLGSVGLLLHCQQDREALPELSPRLGDFVRTNSESLIVVTSERRDTDFSRGVAIGSMLHTDEYSHVEPARYGAGSGFWRLLVAPHAGGSHVWARTANMARAIVMHPRAVARALMVPDFAKHSVILLYMRATDGWIRLRLRRNARTAMLRRVTSERGDGDPPSAFIPEATALAARVAEKIGGWPQSLITETLLGIPTTAHVLGGACMGDAPATGVVNRDHEVFGYPGLYVIDGSAVSANPGVNPALTITALAERAMAKLPRREDLPG